MPTAVMDDLSDTAAPYSAESRRHRQSVTYDLLSPTNGRPRRVTPFLVAGGGLIQTRETFFSGDFTSTEGAFTVGGGVRASAGDRVTIGIDTRVGWELHVRVNGFVGLRLGR